MPQDFNILLSGYRFNSTNITYSFDEDDSVWDGWEHLGPVDTYHFNAISKASLSFVEKENFAISIELWDAFSAFSISISSGKGDINVYHADIESNYIAITAIFQNESDTTFNRPFDPKIYEHTEIALGSASIISGYEGFLLALHETGHALGLTHPANNPLSFNFDTYMTVMSYNYPGRPDATVIVDHWAITPMAYDIAALQQQYGSFSRNSEDGNVYNSVTLGVNGTAMTAQTIVDTGGINDEIDLSSLSGDHIIDLREAIDGNGQWTNARTTVAGKEYIYIAQGSVIENANGGAGNDQIRGNDTGNILSGEGGIDELRGEGGADTLIGGSGADMVSGGAGGDLIFGHGGVAGLDGDAYDGGTDAHETYNTFDTLNYAQAGLAGTDGVKVNLGAGTARGMRANGNGFGLTDTVANVEKVIGTGNADDLQGSSKSEWLEGGNGSDTLRSGGGIDVLVGGGGSDRYEVVKADGGVAHIFNGGNAIGVSDVIVLQNFTPSQVTLTHSGSDLQIRNNGTVVAVVYGQFGDNTQQQDKIAGVEFKNAETIDPALTINLQQTKASDFASGTRAATPGSVQDAVDIYGPAEQRSSPLVLDLDNSGTIDLVSMANSKVRWDLDEDGFLEASGWVAATDGLPAYGSMRSSTSFFRFI